eukprot:6463394-Amphidinium_carterae.2
MAVARPRSEQPGKKHRSPTSERDVMCQRENDFRALEDGTQFPCRNTVRRLGEVLGDEEIMTTMDDVATALQNAEQYLYSNDYVYSQPGRAEVGTCLDLWQKLSVNTQRSLNVAHQAHVCWRSLAKLPESTVVALRPVTVEWIQCRKAAVQLDRSITTT